MTRSIALALLMLAALGAAYLTGRVHGREALQAKLDAAQVRADAAAANDTRELAKAEQAARAASQSFEDQLYAKPDTGGVCIPDGWVR
jgi:hypothetical protein